MANETLATGGSVALVVVGMAVLIAGVGVYSSRTVQVVGGVIGLAGIAVLSLYVANLDGHAH